jgi:hypothetical protein
MQRSLINTQVLVGFDMAPQLQLGAALIFHTFHVSLVVPPPKPYIPRDSVDSKRINDRRHI